MDNEQRREHELWVAERGEFFLKEGETVGERGLIRKAMREATQENAEFERVRSTPGSSAEELLRTHGRGAAAFEKLGRLVHAAHEKTLTSSVWVLHSPYPDGSWRGAEKCVTSEEGSPLLFNSEDAARAFRNEQDLPDMVPVRCLLTTPFVRRPVSVVPLGDLDPEEA